MSNHTYTLPLPWGPAITGWTRFLTAAGASPDTIRVRRGIIRSVARRSQTSGPADITADVLVGLCAVPGWSADHRRNTRAALASFFAWCAENGVCAAR